MRIAPVEEDELGETGTQNNHAACPVPEGEFNDICLITSELLHSPAALIAIIDAGRKWFRSHHPLIAETAAAEFAFCTQALRHPQDALIITDLRKDHRFENTALVNEPP